MTILLALLLVAAGNAAAFYAAYRDRHDDDTDPVDCRCGCSVYDVDAWTDDDDRDAARWSA